MNLTSQDPITQLAFSKGMTTWFALVDGIQTLPYGRNSLRTDLSLVLKEGRGTCSSKHALLKQLADLNDIPNVELVLAMYKMNDRNTPGIELGTLTSDLNYIPEAHCFLRVDGKGIDITTSKSSLDRIAVDIINETVIQPEQVGQYKIELHQQFLKDWIEDENISLKFEEVWRIREKCIGNLEKGR